MRFLFLVCFSILTFAHPRLPVYFEPNQGQAPSAYQFVSPHLLLSSAEVLFPSAGNTRMLLLGANTGSALEPQEPLPGVSNYYLGARPSNWRTAIPHYGRLQARNVYPGIDLHYHSRNTEPEFDFVLAPHADPARIRLAFPGATPHVESDGSLLVHSTLRLHKPVAFQIRSGRRHEIPAHFEIDATNQVTFRLAAYDRSLPLVIDPVLSYSTLLQASNAVGAGIAVDSAGNTYLTGNTNASFLIVNAYQPAFAAGRAAFVAKFNPAGTVLLYATFLAGSSTVSGAPPVTTGLRIAVDRGGSAYVVGVTDAVNFPVTPGTLQPLNKGASDLFVAKLNPAGSALVYSTYLGGSQSENAELGLPGIAVDSSGSAYIAGGTASRNFPVTVGALQSAYAGGASDAFVAKLDPLGASLVYATYYGSPGTEGANAIAIDAQGNAYIAGVANSAGLPIASAVQPAFAGGGTDAFVAKLNSAGTALAYSTYLGGSAGDAAFALAVDAQGSAYAAGVTVSSNFPVTAQSPRPAPVAGDAFLTKITPAGAALSYSVLHGGALDDVAYAVAVDAQGNAYVAGGTESADLPVTPDALQSGPGLIRRGAGRTAASAFLAKWNAVGSALSYATYFGGSSNEAITSLALDSAGNAYITGVASSINFPRTLANYEPLDRTEFGTAFLARFDFNSSHSMALGSVVSAASYQPNSTGVVSPGQLVTLFGSELGPAQLTTLEVGADGRVTTALAGVRVYFDGIAAPLLYVSARQLSAVVPYAVPQNGSTTVQVEYQGKRSNPLVVWVTPSVIGLFTQNASGRGPGAVLNQDGSVNSPANPAEKGSVVVLYGTGEGRTQPEGVDGKVAVEPLPKPLLRILAQVDGKPAEILYVGGAPGLVAGVLQMNIRVPAAARSGPDVPLTIGGMDGPFGVEPGERVTISIK
ncbi:MAG TPA: SBBP repeat-containing protein [Bryobacteraceae bacterium]|nr:SBBP repeat-containing protein [Bryobacteraceae bacterium]